MSSETTQSSYVTSVSYRFVLKWNLKGKDLEKPSKITEKASVVRSDLYLFKADKDLRFYLEIEKSGNSYDLNIKGSKMWSFELAYAFFVIKETAYHLKESNELLFLSPYPNKNILEEDVLIHCVVIADPLFPSSSTKEINLSTQEDELPEENLLPKEGQNTVYFEGRPNITLPEYYSNKVVIDFIRRGDVPCFDVYMATQIIRETKDYKCEVLKILCIQYLMNNITSQSIRHISRAAIDCDLPALERACMQKIASGCIQTK